MALKNCKCKMSKQAEDNKDLHVFASKLNRTIKLYILAAKNVV